MKKNPKFFYCYAKKFSKTNTEIAAFDKEDGESTDDPEEQADMLQAQYESVASEPKKEFEVEPNFFTKEDDPVRALAAVEHVPEQKAVPKNEFQVTVQAGQTANIQFKVFNRTQNDWDKGCYLINDFEGGLHETFFEIRKVIQSNHMFYLEIQIYIPSIVEEQTLQIHF